MTQSQIRQEEGRHKVHTVIHANEGVPSDVRFTSAATHDSFMLRPADMLSKGDIVAMDRAYMDYGKLEEITRIGAFYVTKMKKGLKYEILDDTMWQTPEGLAEVRLRRVRSDLTRPWSFSGLATMVRITMMYYVDFYSLFNLPDKDWGNILNSTSEGPHEPSSFDEGAGNT